MDVRSVIANLEWELTRETNRMLRECRAQPLLDWDSFRSLPLAVGDERIAIRACEPNDFRQFSEEESQREIDDYTTRMETVEGARWLADFMDSHAMQTGADLQW